MERTPAISIRQPWAELIVRGKKSIEIRSWHTDYRGMLWVHTGLKGIPELEKDFGLSYLFRGGYIGSVVLDAVVPMDRQRWEAWSLKHLCYDEYKPGLYAWVLSSPYKFERPIPGPGQLNLFYPNEELCELLNQANLIRKTAEAASPH